MQTIQYVSGGCGSGKTEAAISYINKVCGRLGRNVLLVQPTRHLIDKTAARIQERYPLQQVEVIYAEEGDDIQESVRSRVMRALRQDRKGVVVCITQAAFLGMPSWERKGEWELIVDEIPAVDGTGNLAIPETHGLFTQHFDVLEDHSLYFKIEIGVGAAEAVEAIAANRNRDQVWAQVQDFYRALSHRHTRVYVQRDSWKRIGLPKAEGQGEKYRDFAYHWVLQPSIFEAWDRPTIMGANFQDSMLYLLWQDQVRFEQHPQITPAYDKYPEDVSKRLTIKYFSERRNSITLQNRLEDRFKYALNKFITDEWGSQDFLWIANNRFEDDFIINDAAKRISVISHGINEYRGHTRIAFIAALNDTPPHFKFLHDVCNVHGDLVHRAKAQEVIQQGIMRTALRDRNSRERVEAIVVDRETAYRLKDSLFPEARIVGAEEIDPGLVERNERLRERAVTRLAQSQSDRTKKSRETKRDFLNAMARLQLELDPHNMLWEKNSSTQIRCNDSDHNSKPQIVTSFVPAKTSAAVLTQQFTDWSEVHQMLKSAYALQYKTKDENLLMSGANFDSELTSDTSRGLANIRYVSCMQLDFDSGDIGLDEVRMILDDCCWLAYNSYNNDASAGEMRFRVFIPFRFPVTVDYYHRLWDLFAARFEAFGYTVGTRRKDKPFSGLDKSKRVANSIFYMPCQARREYRVNSFFDDSNWDVSRILNPLDAKWYNAFDYSVEEQRENIEFKADDALSRLRATMGAKDTGLDEEEVYERVNAARNRCLAAGPHEGNEAFWRFGATLKRLGLSPANIELHLRTTAPAMRSPAERRSQIPAIMKSLTRKVA